MHGDAPLPQCPFKRVSTGQENPRGIIKLMDDSPLRRRGPPWFPLALAVLGAVHVLVRTSTHGAAIGADSVVYLSTVENLLAGHGLEDFRGYAPPQYPFGFPLLLAAVAGPVGIEPSEAARLMNAIAFGVTILVAGLWLRRAIFSPALAAGATLVVATSHHLSHSASYVMTEPLFIAFVLIALLCMAGFANQRVSWPVLVWAALFSGLAAATRYAGVALIFAGALMLLARPRASMRRRLRHVGAYGAVSAAPLAAILMHNWLAFGVWERPRHAPDGSRSAFDALQDVASVVTRVVVPEHAPGLVALAFWLALAAFASITAAVATRPMRNWLAARVAPTSAALPAVVFSLAYLLFMVVAVPWFSASTIGDDPRYLLPLYVPLLFVATLVLDRFARLETTGWHTVAKRAATALVVLGGLPYAVLTVYASGVRTATALESGYIHRSYNTVHWQRSETIRHLREHPADGQVLANRFGVLHATLALERDTAERGKYMPLPRDAEALARRLAAAPDGSLVVWFADGEDAYRYGEQHLRSLGTLRLEVELSDGVIFRLTPPASAPVRTQPG